MSAAAAASASASASPGAAVLVVEDEEQLLRMLCSTLIYAGYRVEGVRSGGEALTAAHGQAFDVILLDLGLPDIDGQEVIRKIRASSFDIPIIVVSARTSERDKILALDQGANDYVAKPFDVGELMARIRVALRSRREAGRVEARSGRLEVDFKHRRAIIDGQTVRLSGKEAELLRILADANGEPVTHEEIIEAIWGRASDADIMRVRVLAWQARRKIEPDSANPQFLVSEPGQGYRLNFD
ncbi:MAG: response regulator transcription factor [Phenylobacterium sp.]|uniref:response regulator transcription factor n=1 Tax=Phenylobacterium sp. TaxID=1871053 RepID=UPI00391A65CB